MNYELDREKGRKQKRTYHVNLLGLWKTRDELPSFVSLEPVSENLLHEHIFCTGKEKETWNDVKISSELTEEQTKQVRRLLEEFSDNFFKLNVPNRTNVLVHNINTGQASPMRSSPYRI